MPQEQSVMDDATLKRWQSDHDLLIKISTTLENLLTTLTGAGIPAKCATQEQRIVALEARVKTLEAQRWWLVSLILGAIILSGLQLLLKGGVHP